MRKGNKSKVLILVLALALDLNTFGFAFAESEIEAELLFEEVLSAEETQAAEEEAVITLSEDEVELQAADDYMEIAPDRILYYADRLFKVKSDAVNEVAGGGDFENFDANLYMVQSDDSNLTDQFMRRGTSTTAGKDATGGIDGSACIYVSSGILGWRHQFETGKLYAMTISMKMDSGVNLYDGQRHLAATKDLATESNHSLTARENTATTGQWEQDWFVFEAVDDIRMLYLQLEGSGTIYIDNFYIYEVEEYTETISVDSHELEDSVGNVIKVPANKIPSTGVFWHSMKYTNLNVEEYPVTGVVALMKDNKLERIFSPNTRTVRGALVNGSILEARGSVDVKFEIPEGEDVSRYSYMAYMVYEGNPFAIVGAPGAYNPVTVSGN